MDGHTVILAKASTEPVNDEIADFTTCAVVDKPGQVDGVNYPIFCMCTT